MSLNDDIREFGKYIRKVQQETDCSAVDLFKKGILLSFEDFRNSYNKQPNKSSQAPIQIPKLTDRLKYVAVAELITVLRLRAKELQELEDLAAEELLHAYQLETDYGSY